MAQRNHLPIWSKGSQPCHVPLISLYKELNPTLLNFYREENTTEDCQQHSGTAMISLLLLLVVAVFAILTKWLYPNGSRRIPPVGADFQWEKALPVPYRPFEGKKVYKMTMNLKNLDKTPEDWLFIENTYVRNTTLRRGICQKYAKNTLFANPREDVTLAVREFYTKVTTFLLERYPQYFQKHAKRGLIYNAINGEHIPLDATSADSQELILVLSHTIEEDFLILMKDNPEDEEEEYILRASLTGAPNGFDPSHGFNKPISFIHQPVPQYASKLKFSMAKFFNRLSSSELWMRTNWAIQPHKNVFNLTGNHGRPGESVVPLQMEEVDFDEGAFLRVERQLFTRLPNSKANVMTVRTYLTPLKDIKKDGLGPDLIAAIDGLPEDVAFYKKRPLWGQAVKQYMQI